MNRNESARSQTIPRYGWQTDDELTKAMKPLRDFEKDFRVVNERIKVLLERLPRKDMKACIDQLQLSDAGLNFLKDGIALGKEDSQICAVVEEIKQERLLDPFGDSGDHLNYTSF